MDRLKNKGTFTLMAANKQTKAEGKCVAFGKYKQLKKNDKMNPLFFKFVQDR